MLKSLKAAGVGTAPTGTSSQRNDNMAEDEGTVPPGSVPASVSEAVDQLATIASSDPDLAPTHARGSKPLSLKEECPICFVPLPLQDNQTTYWPCCGNTVCCACATETDRALAITNRMREKKRDLPPMEVSCAFCREPVPKFNWELLKRYEERVEKGDRMAMVELSEKYKMGKNGSTTYRSSDCGLASDEAKAFKLLQRAADFGYPKALNRLGCSFLQGDLGVLIDEEKARVYLEEAAEKGDVDARCHLGNLAEDCQQHDLVLKHFKVAATAGDEDATKKLWKYFLLGKLSKTELEETLRTYKVAVDEMNSEERERYVAFKEVMAGTDVYDARRNIYSCYYHGLMNAKELKEALKVHRGGDVGQVNSILLKCEKAWRR